MPKLDIRRHPDGTRYVQPYLGTNKVTGQPLRPYHRFSDNLTDEECEAEAQEWYESILVYTKVGVRANLGDLLKHYVGWCELSGLTENTVTTYENYIRYTEPLNNVPVKDIDIYDIEDLYKHLLKRGGVDKNGLSPKTVIGLHAFLRAAWNYMFSIGVIDKNPLLKVRPPRMDNKEAIAIDEADYLPLYNVINQSLLGNRGVIRRCVALASYLSLNTGIRRGEALALLRRDVSLSNKTLHVGATVIDSNGQPLRQNKTKGKKSRNIALSTDAVDVLRAHFEWQDTQIKRVGARTPVVSHNGSFMWPGEITRTFKEMAREADLPENVTFHSLRHTHATWLLMQGIDVKTVSERLGHADVATTLRTYAHVLPGRDQQAAEVFSRTAGGLHES